MAENSQSLHSRIRWQLEGIRSTARTLEACPWRVLVAAEREALAGSRLADSPTLTLSPAFPGSWVLNDVCVQAARLRHHEPTSTRLLDALSTLQEISAGSQGFVDSGLDVDAEIIDAIRYAGFAPLRQAWVDRLYRSQGRHAIIILHYRSVDDTEAVLQHDVESAAAMLERTGYHSACVLAETVADTRNARRFARCLADLGVLRNRAEVVRPRQLADLFALLGKADVLMTGGSSLYADAIVTGVPVYAWRTPQQGTARISAAYLDYCRHGDRIRVCSEQYRCLRELVQNSRKIDCIANQRSQLVALTALLNDRPVSSLDLQAQGWIIDPTPPKPAPGLRQHSQQRLHRHLRLAEKFRESPSRFLADSRHRWLRRLNGWGQ